MLPDEGTDEKSLRLQILENIRAEGSTSRVDIARALKVSPASVTAITSELITSGFLYEEEKKQRESGRGRPPVSLKVSPDPYRVLGIKLSDETNTAVLADFTGTQIMDTRIASRPNKQSPEEMLDQVEALVDKILKKTDLTRSDISAVGVGIPGVVSHETGTIVWSPLLTGRNIPFDKMFEERFGIPVLVENDANVLTLAELWFGGGRVMHNFAVVTIEHGVGMGLVLNNRLFRGTQGLGLELGHMKVQLDGALCRCGQRGCLEAYVADYALVREASTAMDRHSRSSQSSGAMMESLFDQAKAGNQAARAIFRRAGRYLSLGLSNVIQLFDPDLIILSGARLKYDYLFAEDVLSEMQSLTLTPDVARTPVQVNSWGDLIWARGATALALDYVTKESLADQ